MSRCPVTDAYFQNTLRFYRTDMKKGIDIYYDPRSKKWLGFKIADYDSSDSGRYSSFYCSKCMKPVQAGMGQLRYHNTYVPMINEERRCTDMVFERHHVHRIDRPAACELHCCPVCGSPAASEETPGYCSRECREKMMRILREASD
jgi:hypothetical protein